MATLFFLGVVVATPGTLELLALHKVDPGSLVRRHHSGDWGDLCEEDRRLNDEAVCNGGRILSSYRINAGDEKVWIITDAVDASGIRRVSTILRPEDY